jgi:hypothetical protein
MLPVSLDCPFLLPLQYSLAFMAKKKGNPEKLAT